VGYHVEVTVEGVVIRGAKVPGAVAALKELMLSVQEHGSGGTFTKDIDPARSFSWVSTATCIEALEASNLSAALTSWRYSSGEGAAMTPLEQLGLGHQHRDVVVHYFEGEKWGDDEQLWEVLAPFVSEGAIITFYGEDRDCWRYVFDGEGLTNQTGALVWDDPD